MPAGLRILFLSSEVVPFSKSGGLADVAGALPQALAARGHRVTVATPLYRAPDGTESVATRLRNNPPVTIASGDKTFPITFLSTIDVAPPVDVLFIDNADLFARGGLYGDIGDDGEYADYPDNDVRFTVFVRAVFEWIKNANIRFDIVHVNDWQTAMACAYLPVLFRNSPVLTDARTVLTIHNLAYQGVFPATRFPLLDLADEHFAPMSPFEFYGKTNFLKAGIYYATKINTVSPTYALEIQADEEMGSGLDGALRRRSDDLSGILNGVDYSVWHPSQDPLISQRYTGEDVDAGKVSNKRALMRTAGFESTRWGRPLVGIVSRLAGQKGFDLISEALSDFIALDINLIVLGTGEQRYHRLFTEWSEAHPERCRAFLAFDNSLAHQIEAGSDMFLMPSRYEPCGLNQIYSLAYGTVPIVRATGGLADTVTDADEFPDAGTGFVFSDYTSEAMLDAMSRALAAYADPARWAAIRERGMACDFSWDRSAVRYEELYESALRVDAATAFHHH